MIEKIKQNPKLSYDSITNLIELDPHLMVAPNLEFIAKELMQGFVDEYVNEHKTLIDKKRYTEQCLREMFNAKMTIDKNFEDDEWLLLVNNKIYYSNGTNKN